MVLSLCDDAVITNRDYVERTFAHILSRSLGHPTTFPPLAIKRSLLVALLE